MTRTRAHLHYSDYTDSHFWDGSPTDGAGIWVRDPILDGDLYNTLDQAMELLDQARKETQAIENVLGTDPAGSQTDLVTRLDKRVSPSGIRRGAAVNLRGPNATTGSSSTVWNWWEGGSVYWQLFRHRETGTVGHVTATYPRAYFTSLEPDLIIVQYARNNQLGGTVQINPTAITTTTCRFHARSHNGSGGWATPAPTVDYYICAVGGFPGS